jgi:hypothetical protein
MENLMWKYVEWNQIGNALRYPRHILNVNPPNHKIWCIEKPLSILRYVNGNTICPLVI